MVRILKCFGAALAMACASLVAAQGQVVAPDAMVHAGVTEVLAEIQKNPDPRALQAFAEAKLVSQFDFAAMTRLATGRAWPKASAAQKQALENAFRTLLVRTYTTALSQVTGTYSVEVKPAVIRPGDADTVVKTLVKGSNRSPVPIDFRMTRTPGGWKVYDVVVENLSLVTNYRGSFQSEISRSGIDGLIKVIEDKNQKAQS
ncbi:MAG: ABC transporter substrate-binding protein [Betaproteobacteria bacterium]|nr:ABC transporter substrate-binding protein [Betaproteobacteria bacterium]MDH3435872.1 ABC transporter substrate-binding protein [Betaproteobacteria bacterium]